MELGREADNGHSLARLKPINQVGGKADTCGGLSTDTAFLFGNGAEGVVSVDARSSLSRLASSQAGMSAGRNSIEWKSRRGDSPEVAVTKPF